MGSLLPSWSLLPGPTLYRYSRRQVLYLRQAGRVMEAMPAVFPASPEPEFSTTVENMVYVKFDLKFQSGAVAEISLQFHCNFNPWFRIARNPYSGTPAGKSNRVQ